MIYDIDYETFYSKDYSIRDLGNWAYTHHPEFDAYMLAVSCSDGEWAGHPKDFDWKLLDGALVVAHNAGFEQAVTDRLVELGIIPPQNWAELVDTADLAAYLGFPRSLAEAAKALLGVEPDKSTRDKAKGKHWNDMTPDFQQEMTRYAMDDARLGKRIWLEHSDKWPSAERLLSRLTREMCIRGLPIDIPKVNTGVEHLETVLAAKRRIIPWSKDPEAKILSPKQVKLECAKHNIAPPSSMAKDSEEFAEWLKRHGNNLPWAKAIGEYRSINMLLAKLQTIQIRTKPDGMMPYALKYGGAHTLRDSGDAGFNPQNLPKESMFGVDMRGMIVAPDGYMLGVVDLSAIEPRCTATLSGDEELVGLLRQGYDPYEAEARARGEYNDPRPLKDVNPKLRQYKKVDVLGMTYGAGPEKIQQIAKTLAGLDLTFEEAQEAVFNFRKRRFIPDLWLDLEEEMRRSIGHDFNMELPSGRFQRYREVKGFGGLTAAIPRNGRMMRLGFWGGSLLENLIQGAARDVFMDRVIEVESQGFDIRLRVHDEIVNLFPEETAEADLAACIKIMGQAPLWWPELPNAAEGHLCKAYKK